VIQCAQQAVSGTVPLFPVPPGPANMVLFTSSGTVWVGPSITVGTSDGFAVSTPVFDGDFPGLGSGDVVGHERKYSVHRDGQLADQHELVKGVCERSSL